MQRLVNDLATITNVVPQTGLGINAPPADGGYFGVRTSDFVREFNALTPPSGGYSFSD
ncbi:MAG: hypothetical protein WCF04_01925 [Candidatus Nanopelagicales bacterium]